MLDLSGFAQIDQHVGPCADRAAHSLCEHLGIGYVACGSNRYRGLVATLEPQTTVLAPRLSYRYWTPGPDLNRRTRICSPPHGQPLPPGVCASRARCRTSYTGRPAFATKRHSNTDAQPCRSKTRSGGRDGWDVRQRDKCSRDAGSRRIGNTTSLPTVAGHLRLVTAMSRLAPPVGFEPTTFRLTAGRSTVEAKGERDDTQAHS